MQFTPQQLTGGPKYQHGTRIGNWSEDQELEHIQLKDYLKKKEEGTLAVTAKQQQLQECLQPVGLDASPSGILQFGQRVQLVSHRSQGCLSANPYDEAAKAYQAIMLTTSSVSNPTVRNSFVIERVEHDDGYDDDCVHYGQIVRIVLPAFSKLQGHAYMHSELVTALAAAKFSRHQEVTATVQPNGETKWQILHPDTVARAEMDGEAIAAGSPIVLRHVQTGSFLASDEIPYKNIFGNEFEVHCFAYYSLNKTQNLAGEKKGEITADDSLRKHGLQNVWTIITDSHGVGASAC